MSKAEIFNLVAGIIGLFADIIAIAAFFSQLVGPSGALVEPINIPIALSILLFLIFAYGWGTIGWMIVRRNYVQRSSALYYAYTRGERVGQLNRKDIDKIMTGAVGGVGTIISPILIGLVLMVVHSLNPKLEIADFLFLGLISSLVVLGIFGVLIYSTLQDLMPAIYSDMPM
ncbi:MAG: hypothetical protein U0822_23105 [Anaerolineae bacterium]